METMPICSPSSWISRMGLILIWSLTRTRSLLMSLSSDGVSMRAPSGPHPALPSAYEKSLRRISGRDRGAHTGLTLLSTDPSDLRSGSEDPRRWSRRSNGSLLQLSSTPESGAETCVDARTRSTGHPDAPGVKAIHECTRRLHSVRFCGVERRDRSHRKVTLRRRSRWAQPVAAE